MTLNQLYYFAVLGETLNYHRASEQLHLTQPALSISISRLEEELGVCLLVRKGHRVELTKSGEIYLGMIRDVLLELESANDKIRRYAEPSGGHVDVGHISSLARDFIPVNIRGFLENKSGRKTTFNFREGSTRPLIQGLKEHKYDVIFSPYVSEQPSIQFIPILEQEIVVIVEERHPLAERESVDLSELAPYPYVHYMKESGVRKEIDLLINKCGWTPKVVCDASDETGIATMVSLGFGVSCVAHVEALDHFPGIRILPIRSGGGSRVICLGYLRDTYHAPAVEEFIHFIQENCIPVPGLKAIDNNK